MKKKRWISFLLAVLMSLQMNTIAFADDAAGTVSDKTSAEAPASSEDVLLDNMLKDYSQYQKEQADTPMGGEDITVPFEQLKASNGSFTVKDNAVSIAEDGFIDINVNVPKAGLYELKLVYMPELGRSAPSEIVVQINHEILYRQAATILLERIWQDETTIGTDPKGNDIIPMQTEKEAWTAKRLTDSSGYYVQPLLFNLNQGDNVITITDNREAFLLKEFSACAPVTVPDYDSYISNYSDKSLATQNAAHIQAEATAWKSDPTLIPGYDRTSPMTEPYKGSKISLNTIGNNQSWSMSGQTVAWSFDAPQDALYEIRFKVKQNFIRGTYSGRLLRIDGEIPFKEAENIQFIYNSKWQMVTLGTKDKPYYIYLTKGKHELSLQVTLGDMGEILKKVDSCTTDINGIYRKFLMILGYTPDTMRDYNLDTQLPEVFTLMGDIADRLDSVVAELSATTGTKGTELLSLTKMSMLLRDFIKKPYEIPAQFGMFTSDMSVLSAWKNDATIRPLEMDYIDVTAPGSPLPKVNPTFFQSLAHSISMFFASFFEDYNNMGGSSDNSRTITVWSTTGRDQTQVLNQLIKSYFNKENGINVNIQLVKADYILPSTVAGNGPDVILNTTQQLPVNYAIRGAAVDLSKFDGFADTVKNFRESAMTPVEFNGGVYGLPEMESFPMLFYRKDILNELGLQVPNTWDDVLDVIPKLQKNNMSFLLDTGIANGVDSNIALDIYSTLYYQRGGTMYEGDGIRTNLDSELAINTFKDWTKLYTDYGLPTNFNAAYRFRTGESPIVIADMSLYNTLMVSAPEVKGLWGIATIPGTAESNGNINKSVKTKTTYTMITQSAKDKEASWEFIKWWVSADTQEQFARGMESLMGASARYMTANTQAFGNLPWATKDLQQIMEQSKWTVGIPEVAGGYFLSRHINNAFRSVVVNKAESRETLITYAGIINEELSDKRREFGLPIYGSK